MNLRSSGSSGNNNNNNSNNNSSSNNNRSSSSSSSNNNARPGTPPLPDDEDDYYDPDEWNANPDNIWGAAWIAALAALDAARPLDQDQIDAIDAEIDAQPIRQSLRVHY